MSRLNLIENFDSYHLWNQRRRELLTLNDTSLFQEELEWLTQVHVRAPKSYCVWNYRLWLLQFLNCWENEFVLVQKLLEKDTRNFHAWNYRRIVAKNIGFENEPEFALFMISKNVLNSSAWHHRSVYLIEINYEQELNLVHNAVFTEPNDQPAWFYLRWLFEKMKKLDFFNERLHLELKIISSLRELDPDCKWVLTFLVFLYQNLNFVEKIPEIITLLCNLDPYRVEFYKSLK